MSTLNERIKEVRKSCGLSQKELSEKIGISQTAVSWSEKPGSNVPDSTLKSLCMALNVNEEWLRNGTGKMFCDFSDDEYSKAAAALSNDALIRSLLIDYWKLNDDSKKLFCDFLHKLSDDVRELENEAAQNEAPDLEKLYNEAPDTAEEFEKLFPPVEDAASDAG